MEKKRIEIKTVPDLIAAHAHVFNALKDGEIKEGTANAMTAQLKGVAFLHKLKIDAAKVCIEAKNKGFAIPAGLLLETAVEEDGVEEK